jgi:hypothetical protein
VDHQRSGEDESARTQTALFAAVLHVEIVDPARTQQRKANAFAGAYGTIYYKCTGTVVYKYTYVHTNQFLAGKKLHSFLNFISVLTERNYVFF